MAYWLLIVVIDVTAWLVIDVIGYSLITYWLLIYYEYPTSFC